MQRVASASVGSRQKTQGKENGVRFTKSEVETLQGLKPHGMSDEAWLKSVAKEKQRIANREAKWQSKIAKTYIPEHPVSPSLTIKTLVDNHGGQCSDLPDEYSYPVAESGRHAGLVYSEGLLLAKIPTETREERNEYYEDQTARKKEALDNNMFNETRKDGRYVRYDSDRKSNVTFGKK